jgi:hypothetical protein
MAFTGKLEKMKIVPFLDVKMGIPLPPFSVMYNPTTISFTASNKFDDAGALVKGTTTQKFLSREPRSLTVELYFDGTGSSPSSNPGLGFNVPLGKNIDLQVQAFMKMAITIDGAKHRAAFLLFVWGTFVFPAVVESAAVTYSLFDSDGRPLRAKIAITAKEHIEDNQLNAILKLFSPDLTHSRVVKAGDTIFNLAKEIYDDESLYLEVARVNNLKNYRKLTPGQTLIFPPVVKTDT